MRVGTRHRIAYNTKEVVGASFSPALEEALVPVLPGSHSFIDSSLQTCFIGSSGSKHSSVLRASSSLQRQEFRKETENK